MQYTLELFGGKEFIISHEEFEAVSKATGNILLSRIGVFVNPSSISCISPVEISIKKVDRQKQQVGVTPSGAEVEKRYGVWYYIKSNNPYQYNEEGQCMLRYDGSSLLPTPEEYETIFKDIDEKQWSSMLAGSDEYQREALEYRSSTNGLTQIGHAPSPNGTANASWCGKHSCAPSDCAYIHNGITYP